MQGSDNLISEIIIFSTNRSYQTKVQRVRPRPVECNKKDIKVVIRATIVAIPGGSCNFLYEDMMNQ